MAKRGSGTAAGKVPAAKRAAQEKQFETLMTLFAQQVGDDFFKELGSPGPASAVERAQDLMFDAFECEDRKKRIALAHQALAVSPLCADAHTLLAEESAATAEERIALYRKGVEGGAKALGKRAFKNDVGHFWGLIETRPYMRALHGLANGLWEAEEHEEALATYAEMLRLNPNDNQGVRYELLDHLLERGRTSEARKLLAQYRNDSSAWWAYGRALLAFLAGGPGKMAEKTLAKARANNPHVPAYLTGAKPMPDELPDYYSPGEESEAIACAHSGKAAWAAVPGAVDWLRSASHIE